MPRVLLSDPPISLREHIEALLAEVEKRNEQRFQAQSLATSAALAAADRAVTKAEIAAEKRFEGVNEFRNTLSDQQRTLMPRPETEILFKALSTRIVTLEQLQQKQIGEGVGSKNGMMLVFGIAAFVSTFIAIILAFKGMGR